MPPAMKRTAAEAFGHPENTAAALSLGPVGFQPQGAALTDPTAYFAQWQAASMSQAPSAQAHPAAGSVVASGAAGERNEFFSKVSEVSAVRCAALVKEHGGNFTTATAIEALSNMATKSSFKLREELLRQPHVKKLCERVRQVLLKPPPGLSVDTLAKASWSLVRFPPEVLGGDAPSVLRGTAETLRSVPPSTWAIEAAAKVLWCLAKAEAIQRYKPLVSHVVKEIVAENGRRAAELSHESLANLLWAVARARRHVKAGDLNMVRAEANDEALFRHAARRIHQDLDTFDVRFLAEIAHTHADVGIRNEGLFKAMCPKILEKQKELSTDAMARAIKAYTRFMIPLTDAPQGFRTMAVVQKGDFVRPSDKPKKRGNTYDKPQALFDKTQVHSLGV